MVGLIAVGFCLIIVVVVGALILQAGKRAAYEITAKHDLRMFVEAEESYYAENEEYVGEERDVVSGDPGTPSDFSVEGFAPSPGVVITVVSEDPFIVTSTHAKVKAVFEYSFEEGIIKRIGDKNGK